MFGKREFVFRDYFIKKIKVLLLSAGTEWHQDLARVTLTVVKTRHELQTEFSSDMMGFRIVNNACLP